MSVFPPELETLPDDELDTFPDEELDTSPDEDTLPDDDEETLPPDEDTTFPDELDDETMSPPELLDVEDTTTLPPPPPPPPKEKPPPNPPPPKNPPDPPITTGTVPALASSGCWIGSGTGAAWLATVTTAGGQAALVVVVVTRRTRGLDATTLRWITRFLTFLTYVAFAGRSATWTAPPPITAPPTAVAQSFAIAIRTDMPFIPFSAAPPGLWIRRSAATRLYRSRLPEKREGRVKRKRVKDE